MAWFHGIDWEKVFAHSYLEPLIPMVQNECEMICFADYSDTSYFQDILGGRPINVHFQGF
jgi:hypothetical protein